MASKAEVLSTFRELDAADKKEVAAAVRALEPPPASMLGWLWLIIVGSLAIALLGGVLLVYFLIQDDKSTDVVAAITTGALGALIGLIAPSPVQSNV